MVKLSVSEARGDLAKAIERSREEPVVVERYGRAAAVIVSVERYDELLAAWEDAQDVVDFDEAMAEEGPNVPWNQVKLDLGWT